MKKTILTVVLAALCLKLSNPASAQIPSNQAIDITSKGIQIGQKVPYNVALSKYKGKLIILDFWATWCSPCIAMIPKMEVLQKQFNEKIQVVTVTYQTEKEVSPFLQRLNKGKPSLLPGITDDKDLHKLFPHVYLPHYVWIDSEGIVKAITGYQEVTAANIEAILAAERAAPILKQKRDMKVAYNKAKPFLIGGNGGDGSEMVYHAVFSKYVAGIQAGYSKTRDSNSFTITARNLSIPNLFKLALGAGKQYFPANRVKLEVANPTLLTSKAKGDDYTRWKQQNGFFYEVIVPLNLEKEAYVIMEQDLKRFLTNYSANVEERTTRCLGLVRIGEKAVLNSAGGKPQVVFSGAGCKIVNAGLNQLIGRLDAYYMQNSPLPIINATGYTGPVDMEINANMSDTQAINRELEKYGLRFTEIDAKVKMVVIKDKANNNAL